MAEIPELSDIEWEEILKKLTLRAAWKFRRYGWLTNVKGECAAPGGSSPQDIAMEAISKFFNGERKYNPARYPSFYDYLKSSVDSLTSNLYAKANKRKVKEVRLPQSTSSDGDCIEMEFESNVPDPAQTIANRDLADKVRKVWAKEFANDVVAMGIKDCIEAGITKRAEQAELLEVDATTIDSALKRLRRVMNKKL